MPYFNPFYIYDKKIDQKEKVSMETFCPFINGNCVSECVFNNGCYKEGDSENCNLKDAVRNIQSNNFEDRALKNYLQSIESKLKDIELNTNSDHTESWSIKSELDDISRKLDQIIEKL